MRARHSGRPLPKRARVLRAVFGAAIATLGLLFAGPTASSHATTPAGVKPGRLVVAHGQLQDGHGKRLQLQGVDRSGSEYVCLGGKGIFAGPADRRSVSAIASWGTQIVRLPLNEDCWLGINHVPAATSGADYRDAIAAYVHLLASAHMDVILDLHWSGSGVQLSNGQQPMPDASHATTFWAQVAQTFANRSGVIFEIYNEPYGVSWSCWSHGCTVPAGGDRPSYQAVGMQNLLDTIRHTGADNPVIVDGLERASSFNGWQAYKPNDPARQLIAGWHIYGPSSCTEACWERRVEQIRPTPIMVTELGETDCKGNFTRAAMGFLDRHHISYLAWAWDTWPGCKGPALITDYAGTPTAGYGESVRSHFLARSTRGRAPG
jgi:hypothetical protein